MWRLVGTTATWQCDQLRASLDLQQPQRGLERLAFQGKSLRETALMQVFLADRDEETGGCERSRLRSRLQLEECYVRGSDLVATYADSGRNVFPEFYWRVSTGSPTHSGAVVLDLLVSMRTDLPDGDPSVDLRCRLPAESCDVIREPGSVAEEIVSLRNDREQGDIGCGPSGIAFSFHLPESLPLFALMFHAADVMGTGLEADAAEQVIRSTVSFFGGRVERGVIRRATLRGVLVPEERAGHVVTEQWLDLLAAPPPLAT